MSEERKVIAVSKLPKYLCDTDKTASRKIHNSMHTACARKSNACSNNCLYAARGVGGHSTTLEGTYGILIYKTNVRLYIYIIIVLL